MHPLIRLTAVLVLVGLLGTLPALSQERTFATRGTTELGGSISFASISSVSHGSTSDATTIFTFAPQMGYFITDGLELGFNPGISVLLSPGVSIITSPGGNSTTLMQLFFAPAYNFRINRGIATPFLEVPVGYTAASNGSRTSGFSWGVRGGVKVAAEEHLLLSISAQYLLLTLNPSGATERYGLNYFSVGIGVGGYF